jgi:hypothetical protein
MAFKRSLKLQSHASSSCYCFTAVALVAWFTQPSVCKFVNELLQIALDKSGSKIP